MSRHIRRAQLIAHAQANGLDGVLVHSWHRQTVGWLTGYSPGYVTNAASLWLGAGGEQLLGVRFGFDQPRAALTGLPVVVAAAPTAVVPKGARRIGLVAGDIAVDEATPALLASLQAAGIEHIDLRDVVDDLQESKLEDEVLALQHAGDVADAALVTWGDSAPEGKTDYQVVSAIEATARAAGARRAYCLVGVGPGAVVSECFGTVIGPHDAVGLELTLYVDEWCMHVNTQLTAARGTEHDAQAVCASARAAMLASMRPGVAIDEVVAVGDRVLAAAGVLNAKEYDFGHGLSGDTPAHPRLISGTGRVLADHVVTALHVAVRVPGGATGFVGGPVVVEASGARELNPSAPWAVLTRAAD
ncbi:M24 family metallopeptidase [Jatrophihabitans cynanchi]|uniref:M24 family metallopeptidase n=1 Tax=Jatrophihabitans cynanchi TaxID=2944128 RepID=A0ABY7K2G0_9ACTN|nr:M24 family metallopeptidase [Jatrophihabitans sp. SB3-54]WAX59035.1 M24 family metallopeptidase [Jatrophihabitans sp. SB3-54]